MKNSLSDLNNYLFAQMERLDDEDLTEEALDVIIRRGNAIANVASQIIANGNLQLKAVMSAREVGLEVKTPALLQIAGVEGK